MRVVYLQTLLQQQATKALRPPAVPPTVPRAQQHELLVTPVQHGSGLVEDDDPEWLTYRQAAIRVRRDVKSIKRWRRDGMPGRMGTDGAFYVRVEDLLAWWRARMLADPTRRRPA